MSPSHQKVSDDAEKAIAECHRIMRSKGYRMKSITQSACTEFRYSKTDPLHEPEVCIEMHHGRGKWGPGKAILGLYHKRTEQFKMSFRSDKGDPTAPVVYETSEYSEAGAKMHEDLIRKIHTFLSNL